MLVSAPCTAVEAVVADDLAQLSEPQTCPGELHTEYCKADGDYDERGPWCDNHDNTERNDRDPDNRDRDPARQLVSHVNCSMHRQKLPSEDLSDHQYQLIPQNVDQASSSTRFFL